MELDVRTVTRPRPLSDPFGGPPDETLWDGSCFRRDDVTVPARDRGLGLAEALAPRATTGTGEHLQGKGGP